MLRTLLIAGVVLSTLTGPSHAGWLSKMFNGSSHSSSQSSSYGGKWNVIKVLQRGGSRRHSCIVVQRNAYAGEKAIGSYKSKRKALRKAKSRRCNNRNYRKSNDRR